MSKPVNTNASGVMTTVSAFHGQGNTFSPQEFFQDTKIEPSTSPVAYEFSLKRLGQFTAGSSSDPASCPCQQQPCPPTGVPLPFGGACCHGGQSCEVTNWTPLACKAMPSNFWCPASGSSALDPENYTVDKIYSGTITADALTALAAAEEQPAPAIVIQQQSLRRLNGPASGQRETSFIYATFRMPILSITLEIYQSLTNTSFSLDPYFIWYDLTLTLSESPIVGEPSIPLGPQLNVTVFGYDDSSAAWTQILTSGVNGSWQDVASGQILWTGDSLQVLHDWSLIALVIVNPLYGDRITIPDNFMDVMYPLIKNVENS